MVLQVIDPIFQDEKAHGGGKKNVEDIPHQFTGFFLGGFCFRASSKVSEDVPGEAEHKEDVEPKISIEIPEQK